MRVMKRGRCMVPCRVHAEATDKAAPRLAVRAQDEPRLPPSVRHDGRRARSGRRDGCLDAQDACGARGAAAVRRGCCAICAGGRDRRVARPRGCGRQEAPLVPSSGRDVRMVCVSGFLMRK
jgi:hypothetical protein